MKTKQSLWVSEAYCRRRGSAAAVCGNRWYPPSNPEAVLTARGAGGAVPELVRYFGPSWTQVGVRGQATPSCVRGSQRLTRLLDRGRHHATACS